MSAPATAISPLRYFIHEDFDALRMEVAGSLAGRAAQRAYESWRSALSLTGRARLVVDISHVTEADEQGRAVLRAWHGQDARIIASSTVSREIAKSISTASVPQPAAPRPIVRRLVSYFDRHAAGNPATAERLGASSAEDTETHAENIGFPVAGEVE